VKRLIAILLFTLFYITLLGYHFVFSFQLELAKAEMRNFLQGRKSHKDVVQLSLSKEESDDLFWENDHEFRYKGEMYDVIEKKANGNKVLIRCVSDKKETGLLNEYQRNNKRNSSNSKVVQLITAHFVIPAEHCLKLPERVLDNYFKDYSSSLQNIAPTVILPPPDVC
jgi:hypothetical protein